MDGAVPRVPPALSRRVGRDGGIGAGCRLACPRPDSVHRTIVWPIGIAVMLRLHTGPLIDHNLPATRRPRVRCRRVNHACSATPANVHVLADGLTAGAAPLQSRLPVATYYLFVPDNTVWVDFAALSSRLVATAAPTLDRPHGSVVVAPVHGSAGADRKPISDWCERRACALCPVPFPCHLSPPLILILHIPNICCQTT